MFFYAGKNQSIIDAVNLANKKIEEFLTDKFDDDMPDYFLGDSVSEKIDKDHVIETLKYFYKWQLMEVKEYWYWSSNVMGYYSEEDPNVININKKSLSRSIVSLAKTFIHESCHAAGFSHGKGRTRNFYYVWKAGTVNFLFPTILFPIDRPSTQHENIVKRPRWHRVLFFWR